MVFSTFIVSIVAKCKNDPVVCTELVLKIMDAGPMSTSLWKTLSHLKHLILTTLINSCQTSGFSKALIQYYTASWALPNSRREFPGILRKLRSVIFFPVISLFVQFHYHLQQTLSVNYNVLSIKLPTVKVKNRNRPTCIRREN